MLEKVLATNPQLVEWSYAIIRVGVGVMFAIGGYQKVIGGVGTWHWLGNQMAHLGITFLPVAWGFMAACSELCGGVLLVLGLGTRFAAFFLLCVMIVALTMHLSNKDPFVKYSHPLTLIVLLAAFLLAGGGAYSLDTWLK